MGERLFKAEDISSQRRELINWYRAYGLAWYTAMIQMGRQQVMPNLSPKNGGMYLSRKEEERLTRGDLWFVDSDTCDLVEAAYPSMPGFTPQPSDLPSKIGFVLFAHPIMKRDMGPMDSADDIIMQMLRTDINERPKLRGLCDEVFRREEQTGGSRKEIIIELVNEILPGSSREAERNDLIETLIGICGVRTKELHDILMQKGVSVSAVSWSPIENAGNHPHGGVWMSFYVSTRLRDLNLEEGMVRACRNIMTELTVDNEVIIPWGSPDAGEQNILENDPRFPQYGWGRMLLATFRLAAQQKICSQETSRLPRAERRRSAREGLPERDVTVVKLRRRERGEPTGQQHGGYQCRWAVRGHWRNQWYPSVQDHRPIWIDQHIKGPDDAPLRGGERVTVI